MIVSTFLIFLGLLMLTWVIVYRLLPNFSAEKRIAKMASLVVKSDFELRRIKMDPLTIFIADKWMPLLVHSKIPFFNGKTRRMFTLLELDNSFEEDLASKLMKSIVGSFPVLLLPFIFKIPVLILGVPVFIVFIFLVQVFEIRNDYKKRQREVIRDLPHLMSKMMIALETGESFLIMLQSITVNNVRMQRMLSRLKTNLSLMTISEAVDLFAAETDIPVMRSFAAAIKIGVNNDYSAAKGHFDKIKGDLRKLRLAALRDATKSQPEKVKYLYILIASFAFISVIFTFIAVFSQLKQI